MFGGNYNYRKRQNPLYEEEQEDMVLKKTRSGQSSLTQCPCLGMIVFGLLSVVTFVLVVLMLLGVINVSSSESGKLFSDIKKKHYMETLLLNREPVNRTTISKTVYNI